jgi:hypothetical protein
MGIAEVKRIVSLRTHHRSIVIGIALAVTVCSSYAQEKKVPAERDVTIAPAPSEEPKAPLPKIENPEFVITGQETIELPGAVKNDAGEASSYAPPVPSAGAKESDVARTASKLALRNGRQAGLNGKVYGTIGNYLSPSLGAWFGKSFTDGSVAVNARYASSDGYTTNTQWQSAGFGIAGSYKLPASGDFLSESRWKSELGVGGEQYRAFGSSVPGLQRTRNDLDFLIGFDSRYVWNHPSFSPIDYSTGVAWTRTSLGDSATAIENELAVTTTASALYETVPVRASVDYRVSAESMPRIDAQTMHWLAVSGDGRVMAADNVQISFGAAAYMYRGNDTPMSLRLYPRVGARYYAAPWLTLRAGFEPTVTRMSLGAMVKQNKYILNAVSLRPSDAPFAVFVGFNCIPMEDAAFSVTLDYRHVNDYTAFAEIPQTHVWTAYPISDIRVLKTDMRARYAVSPAGALTGFVVFNSTTHKDSSSMLPYVPAVSAGIVYRHSFQSTMSAEVTAEYAGKRHTDFTAWRANAGYCVFGAKGEYAIEGNLRLTAEIQNLFNQNYYIWNGYRERQLFIAFGISYLW